MYKYWELFADASDNNLCIYNKNRNNQNMSVCLNQQMAEKEDCR